MQVNVSKARIFMLYILIMSWIARNTILLRRRSGEYYSSIDSMAIIQILVVALIFVILLISPLKNFLEQLKNSSIKYYFAYILLGIVSGFWSVNYTYSIYRALEVFALSSATLYICLNTSSTDETIQRIRLIVWSTLILTVLGSIKLLGFHIFLRNNGLGASAAMTACFFVVWKLTGDNRSKRTLQAAAGTTLVLISLSLASWWSFWFGICYGILFTRKKFLVLIIILMGIILFFSIGTETRTNLLFRDKQVEDLESMTGRKYLWADFMAASQKRPILGYGFASGTRTVGDQYATNTHNTFISILLNMGWVGVFCWTLFILSFIWELIRYRHNLHPEWLACVSALAAGALNSMSAGYLGEQWFPPTTVFISFLGLHMAFLRQAKDSKIKQPIKKPLRFKKIRIRW